ncbi:asparagine synthase (glutamine-hydrolyzing) [Magnetococcus sp. PR-3]|uniref:asparagine synthase (glutamine-hydrolyzing) n=1 Tax=Magnetococcus sp. PR-3 TaxID=3120355 RepID=UPI002FCE29E5
MCGICGFYGHGNTEDLARMNAQLHHRGPDDGGVYQDPTHPLFLGHRRLSILDLAGGQQPMWSANGQFGVVFNGEIYNFQALRQELEAKGHHFITDHSDTEVVLHAWQAWGPAMVERFNGMWALALYDRTCQQLFLSRDRFGKKPLYYHQQGSQFVFASELRALMQHPSVPKHYDQMGLMKYFAYGYVPAPKTLYKTIHKLPAGCNLQLSLGSDRVEITRYWRYQPDPFTSYPKNPEESWGEELRALLGAAVKRRMIADRPLGFFLSGGVDSSAILGLAAQQADGASLKAFSIGFEEANFDETHYARTIANKFGLDHRIDVLSMDKARALLPEILSKLDDPFIDTSLLPTYLLCQQARKEVVVALAGDGADELLAGYDPFKVLRQAHWYHRLMPRLLHGGVRKLMDLLPTRHGHMSLEFKIKRALRGLGHAPPHWMPIWLGALEPSDLEELFQTQVDPAELYAEAVEDWTSCHETNPVDRTLSFYINHYLQEDILVKSDRAGMMNSLEIRAPFLDIELVDFIRRIPWQYKLHKGQTKYLLKRSLEGLIPDEILYRRKKGFGVPVGGWFRDGHLPLKGLPHPPMLNPLAMQNLEQQHLHNQADHKSFLWNALALGHHEKQHTSSQH